VCLLFSCRKKEHREEYWPGGKIKSQGYVAQASDGSWVKTGPWTYYWNTGKKAEGEYDDGKLTGKVDSLGVLVDGRNGPWTFWSGSGTKILEAAYKKGIPHGVFTRWDLDGNLKGAVEFRDSKYVRTVTEPSLHTDQLIVPIGDVVWVLYAKTDFDAEEEMARRSRSSVSDILTQLAFQNCLPAEGLPGFRSYNLAHNTPDGSLIVLPGSDKQVREWCGYDDAEMRAAGPAYRKIITSSDIPVEVQAAISKHAAGN
jgi:hypothetical protein